MRRRFPATSRFLAAGASHDGDRVTTLELFFDLVFVFAFRQVTEIMLHDPAGMGMLRGLITLALVWWAWTSYAWLANQARADSGVVRVGLILATATMFLVALAIPEAWHDLPGALSGPLVFVVCYLIVRLIHILVYLILARDDPALRRQVLLTLPPGLAPGTALLVVGALVGEPWQLWLWLAAICLDPLLVYLTWRAARRGWRLQSASHFAERHALVIILALGESVIAIGVVAARIPVSWEVLAAALLAIALAVGLWWSYFSQLEGKAEHELARRTGVSRAALAVDAYTYLHFLLVAGIVIVAVGIEEAMVEIGSEHPLGLFAGGCLGAGIALYLAGTVLFWRRVSGEWTILRSAGAVAAVAVIPALAASPSLIALGIAAALLAAMLGVEGSMRRRADLPHRVG